jgi:hypothetical protein
MDLKDALKGLQSQQEIEEPKITIEEPTEDSNLLTFEAFKRLVGDLIFEDKILIQMKLKWYEDATQMIVFQGVRSNVIARLRSNGQHVINRSVFKKRIQDVLEKDMEPSVEQKQAKERTKEEPIEEPPPQ